MTRELERDLQEGSCSICLVKPRNGWNCIAMQWLHDERGDRRHPGRCWGGVFPTDTEALKRQEDIETEKQRQAVERRQMRLPI